MRITSGYRECIPTWGSRASNQQASTEEKPPHARRAGACLSAAIAALMLGASFTPSHAAPADDAIILPPAQFIGPRLDMNAPVARVDQDNVRKFELSEFPSASWVSGLIHRTHTGGTYLYSESQPHPYNMGIGSHPAVGLEHDTPIDSGSGFMFRVGPQKVGHHGVGPVLTAGIYF